MVIHTCVHKTGRCADAKVSPGYTHFNGQHTLHAARGGPKRLTTARVLFIRGFDTDYDSTDGTQTYEPFDVFFLQSDHYSIRYFHYNPEDNLYEVFTRLCRILRKNQFEILIGHSMGGCLLFRYATHAHPRLIAAYHRLIFLMPLLYRRPVFASIFTMFPHVRKIHLQRCMSASTRRHDGNIWNESARFVSCKQIVQMYNEMMPQTDSEIVDLFVKTPNAVMMYASDEMLNVVPDSIRTRIHPTQCVLVDGKHECFRDASFSLGFFRRFRDVLLCK
jgi:hypothetical protein